MARLNLNFEGAGVSRVISDATTNQVTVTIPGAVPGRFPPADFNLGTVTTSPQTIDYANVIYDGVIRVTLGINVVLNFINVPTLARGELRIVQAGSGGPYIWTPQLDGNAGNVAWGNSSDGYLMSTGAGVVDKAAFSRSSTRLEFVIIDQGF